MDTDLRYVLAAALLDPTVRVIKSPAGTLDLGLCESGFVPVVEGQRETGWDHSSIISAQYSPDIVRELKALSERYIVATRAEVAVKLTSAMFKHMHAALKNKREVIAPDALEVEWARLAADEALVTEEEARLADVAAQLGGKQ